MIQYTYNRWLFGVRQIIIDAYGTSFQNMTSSGQQYADAAPFMPFNLFYDGGNVLVENQTYINGDLINTAASGALSVTTITAANAGYYTVGMPVIVYGYDQQGAGFGPNMRFFEYKTVANANASTGVVTFTDALSNSYDSRWWDTANYAGLGLSFGAPRILSLARANFTQPQLIWVKGATFLLNVWSGEANIILDSAKTILEDVTAPYFAPSCSSQVLVIRCNFGALEPDKLVDSVVVQDSTVDGTIPNAVSAATGVNSLKLVNTKVINSKIIVSPRSLIVDNCDITPAAGLYQGITSESDVGTPPIRSMYIANTRIYNTGQSYGASNKGTPGNSLTVGSVIGTDILIASALPLSTVPAQVAHSIDYQLTITNTVSGNTGIITAIYYDSVNAALRISGTWTKPSPGDVFYFYDVMAKWDGGGNVIIGPQIPFWRNPPVLASPSTG